MMRSASPNSSARSRSAPRELLDEAIARTARVDPQINAVVVKHYDYAERQIDKGLVDGPFTGVPFLLKDLDLLEGTRTTSGRKRLKDYRRRSYKHPRPALSRCRRRDFRQELQSGIRPDADHGVTPVRPDPQSLEYWRIPPAARPAARPRQLRRAFFPWRMPATAAVRSAFPLPRPACSALKPTRARNPLGPDRGEGWGGFSCGHVAEHQRARQRGDAGCDPRARSHQAPMSRRRRSGRFLEEVGRDPGQLRIAFTDKSPYGDAIDPEIAAAIREVAAHAGRTWPSRRGACADACRRSGRGDGDNCRRQHRAERAA